MGLPKTKFRLRNPSTISLNINAKQTAIGTIDPLTALFRSIFERFPSSARGHVVAALGEMIGTLMFIFMGFSGVQVALIASNPTSNGHIDSTPKGTTPQTLLYISLSVGFSLLITAWVFFRISGALFNPVVSIAMVLIGAITPVRGVLLIVVQIGATIGAGYLCAGIFPAPMNVDTLLHPQVTIAQGVLIEMILTSLLVFTILMLAAEQHEATFLAPVGIGLAGFLCHMIGVFWTGASLNPARSLAAALVSGDWPHYHWIYTVGPISGGLLAVVFYKLIKSLEYESIQDTVKPPSKMILPTNKGDLGTQNTLDQTPKDSSVAPQHQRSQMPSVQQPVPVPARKVSQVAELGESRMGSPTIRRGKPHLSLQDSKFPSPPPMREESPLSETQRYTPSVEKSGWMEEPRRNGMK